MSWMMVRYMISDEYLGPDEDDLHDDERVYPEYFEVHKKNPDTDTKVREKQTTDSR